MTTHTYDQLLLLKDAGAVTVTGVAQVGGANRVLDLGLASAGNVVAVIDTLAAPVGTGTYDISVEGSTDLAFTTPVQLGSMKLTAMGRNELHFSNRQGQTVYRYLRGRSTLGGTTPSINYTMFVSPKGG